MSNLLKRYVATIESMGIPSNPIYFLYFVFVWSMGYVVGVLSVVLGMQLSARLVDLEEITAKEMEKMVARMNEEGPNN